MALIICSECGKEVSDKATTCPNCGAPIVSRSNSIKITVIADATSESRRIARFFADGQLIASSPMGQTIIIPLTVPTRIHFRYNLPTSDGRSELDGTLYYIDAEPGVCYKTNLYKKKGFFGGLEMAITVEGNI